MISNLARVHTIAVRKPGRIPAGPGGEHVASMPKVRVSRETLLRIQKIAQERGVPVWQVVAEAVG